MPKQRKNDLINCVHFKWRVGRRNGVWFADGRSKIPDAGRHSLGTRDREEALRLLPELDRQRAEDLGLVARSDNGHQKITYLPLEDGRRLYEAHIARPEVAGGLASRPKNDTVPFLTNSYRSHDGMGLQSGTG